MSQISEWEVGSEIMGKSIYIRLKGYIDRKFSHSFLTIEDADKLAQHILLVTRKLKDLSSGKCIQCNNYITNKDVYYELAQNKKIHKNCLGDYAENHNIKDKLVPQKAKEFDTYQIYFEHKEK